MKKMSKKTITDVEMGFINEIEIYVVMFKSFKCCLIQIHVDRSYTNY